MYGSSSYDWDALGYEPPVVEPDPYFIETPCRAVLHAAHVESASTQARLPRPAGSVVSAAWRQLRKGAGRT